MGDVDVVSSGMIAKGVDGKAGTDDCFYYWKRGAVTVPTPSRRKEQRVMIEQCPIKLKKKTSYGSPFYVPRPAQTHGFPNNYVARATQTHGW